MPCVIGAGGVERIVQFDPQRRREGDVREVRRGRERPARRLQEARAVAGVSTATTASNRTSTSRSEVSVFDGYCSSTFSSAISTSRAEGGGGMLGSSPRHELGRHHDQPAVARPHQLHRLFFEARRQRSIGKLTVSPFAKEDSTKAAVGRPPRLEIDLDRLSGLRRPRWPVQLSSTTYSRPESRLLHIRPSALFCTGHTWS